VGSDSSAGGSGGRRGFGRAAAVIAAAIVLGATGCGDSGHGAETDPEKGSDAAILNAALSRELTILSAYRQGRSLLRPAERPVVRQLYAHEGEYVDALTKAVRGLGGDTEAEAEELDFGRVKDQVDLLDLAYELEGAALDYYVDSAAQLYTAAPRTLDAALAAGHAQHLVVLRQGLGASAAEAIPEGFDSAQVPPPGESPGGGG
jgi:Ferritin-like domain